MCIRDRHCLSTTYSMKYRTSSTFSSYLLSIDRLVSPNPNILCATYRKRKWRLRRNWKELFFAVWNGTPSFNWQHQYVWIVCKKRGGLCRLTESVCVVASNKRGWKAYTTFTSCENVAYSNKVFFLCWVGYALEGSIFSLSKCDFSRRFHTERSWHTYRFTIVIVSGRQDLPSA